MAQLRTIAYRGVDGNFTPEVVPTGELSLVFLRSCPDSRPFLLHEEARMVPMPLMNAKLTSLLPCLHQLPAPMVLQILINPQTVNALSISVSKDEEWKGLQTPKRSQHCVIITSNMHFLPACRQGARWS
jgi:hypothetical protein